MEGRRRVSARQRELYKRSLVLGAASLFFFMLAAMRAMSADYGAPADNPWEFPEEDAYDVMSYDDHVLASRMQRRIIGDRPVYSRRKASKMHDSVTIVINESTTSELTSSNDLKRDSSNSMVLDSWLTPSLKGGLGTKQHGAAAGGNSPTISYSNNRAHKSDSTVDRSQSFRTTLTGEVIWVHENGFLVVEAKKSVNVNGEEQTVKLTGTVNPAHMDSKSTVAAEYLIDMSVNYSGSGPMTRMDKRGWASKLIDFLNPF